MKKIGIEEETGKRIPVQDSNSNNKYLCPAHLVINEKVYIHKVIRDSTIFFRYNPNSRLNKIILKEDNLKHGGESLLHFNVKNKLCDYLSKENKASVDVEKVFKTDSVFRIADVFSDDGKTKTVYEIQLSAITIDDIEARTSDYLSVGVNCVIWCISNVIVNRYEIERYFKNSLTPYAIIDFEPKNELTGSVIL